MNTIRSILGAIAMVLSGTGTVVSADLTYYLVDYPADQDGWELSGYIRTDGSTGQSGAANILEWSWTASRGADSTTHKSTDPFAEPNAAIIGTINANLTELWIPPGTDQCGHTVFLLSMGQDSLGTLYYQNRDRNEIEGEVDARGVYLADRPSGVLWSTEHDTDMWDHGRVIAVVPEPSTFILLTIGALGLLGYGWRRV